MNSSFLRRYSILAFIVVALIGGFNACTVITTESQTSALTRSGGWMFDSFSSGSPTVGLTTGYKGMTVVFTSSGSVTFTTSAEARATGGVADTYTGTWSLSSLQTLSMTVPGLFSDGVTAEIVELNSSTLRFSSNFPGIGMLEFKWTAK